MLTTATRNEIISLARSGKTMAFVLFVRSNIRCGHGRTKVLDINILVRTNSASKNIAKMINEDYEITFGVELELVFGFREGLLRTYLKSIQDSSQIVKGISEGDRVTMASHLNSGGYTDRPRYMGWGLTGQTQHPLVGWNSEHSIRTYGDEPMQIARAIFPDMLYDIGVHFDSDKQSSYSRWYFTDDCSVAGVDEATLLAKLRPRIGTVGHCKFSCPHAAASLPS